jgi:hypothetical protein
MAQQDGLHVQPGQLQRAPTAAVVKEQGKAREAIARMWVGGVVLGGLIIALGCAMIWRPEHVQPVLTALGTITGFLLGQRTAPTQS